METLKNLITWLRDQSVVVKIISLVVGILLGVIALFLVGCSSVQATIPKISDNKFGAEGIVQKEKNVQKQTKWFFKPDSLTSNDE